MKSSNPGRPLWSEGMLVGPQHLQYQDAYHEQLLEARLRGLVPATWGLQALSIDKDALAEGRVSVLHVSAVFPDGTAVDYPGEGSSPPLSRTIAQHFDARVDTLPVYLGVQLLQERAPNILRSEDPTPRRFAPRKKVIHDLASGKTRTIDVVDPHLVLLLGDERRDDFAVIQIAEVTRAEAGRFALSRTFIPPLLAIGAAENLLSSVQGVIKRAHLRRRRLTAERSAQGTVQFGLRQTDLDRALFIMALDTSVPRVRNCVADPRTSPHVLYHALLQLCGALAYPTGTGDPTEFPLYAAGDLRGTFSPLFELATRQLETEFSRHYIELDLSKTKTHWHVRDSRLRTCKEVLFALTSDQDKESLQKHVSTGGKVASFERMKRILQASAPGIPIDALSAPPVGVPSHADELFFRLDPTSSLFEEARQSGDLAIVLRPPLSPQHTPLRVLGLLDTEDA